MRAVVAAARADSGVAFEFARFAHAGIDSGALRVLLDKYTPSTAAFHLYYPNRAYAGQVACIHRFHAGGGSVTRARQRTNR